MTEPSSTRPCPGCGTPASGSFCSSCGASLAQRSCSLCGAALSPRARFCHRCGRAVAAGAGPQTSSSSHRGTWIAAAILCVILVGVVVYQVSGGAPSAALPEMANAGGVSARDQGPGQSAPAAGVAPDISAMTPRERFDRLFNRIMQAADRHDSAEVRRFTPMALGAYQQLDTRDVDARYHTAVLYLELGDVAPAYALADTILQESPGHLFGYLIRGTGADLKGDQAALRRARRDFLAHYETEMAANRVEYLEHKSAIEEFKEKAKRSPD